MECKTVRVVSPDAPGGFTVINETDYKEGEHELWAPPSDNPPSSDNPPEGGKQADASAGGSVNTGATGSGTASGDHGSKQGKKK
jgi:hypothetical protein